VTRWIFSFLLCSLTYFNLFCEIIQTFYGDIDVEDPVLLDLIRSPAMQRLKHIHQYGVSYYTTHREEYTRFAHSIGVFAVLKLKGASLEEQIAGLLHDVSHTVFSHVGDWVFKMEHLKTDYQTSIHLQYLKQSGLEQILNAHGYTAETLLPNRKEFIMLEQSLPNLNADRIDYNIQGAYFQHFLTKEEGLELFADIVFEEGKWIITKRDLATRLTRFSLFMTKDCWGSADNYMGSKWLSEAILQGIHIGLISWDDFHFGVDQDIWDRLSAAHDPVIQQSMYKIMHSNLFYRCVEPEDANTFIKFKCRGIDPWIKYHGNCIRLSSIDTKIADELEQTKKTAARGWPLEIFSE
jgi:hypothetical protein